MKTKTKTNNTVTRKQFSNEDMVAMLNELSAQLNDAPASLTDDDRFNPWEEVEAEVQDLDEKARTALLAMCKVALEKSDGVFDRILDRIAEKSNEEMTPEETLLAAIYHLDGSSPTPDDAQPERITDFLEKIGKKYLTGTKFTVGDLTQLGREYARKVVSGAEGALVCDNGETFSWKCPRRYAPSIVFEVGDDDPLYFDDCGWINGVIDYDTAQDALPLLGFDPKGDNDNEAMTWGKATVVDGTWHFRPTPANEATILLLGVTWGGAHSTSRGCERDVAMSQNANIVFFEKSASKGGGEGVDFYLIKITPESELQKAVIAAEERLQEVDGRAEDRFFQRHVFIQSLEVQYDKLDQEIAEEKKKLSELYDQVEEEVSNDLEDVEDIFISCGPAPDYIPDKIERNYSYDSSLRDLARASLDTLYARERLARAVGRSEVRIAQYRKLAPKYARLCGVVKNKCLGWMELRGTTAIVWLPNTGDTGAEMARHEFSCNEAHLQRCLHLIWAYISNDARIAEENARELAELLK